VALNEVLAAGTSVYLPDARFPAIVAAQLAAEAAASKKKKRVTWIRQLVPVALRDPTALDAVLARLLLASTEVDEDVLETIADDAPKPLSAGRDPRD